MHTRGSENYSSDEAKESARTPPTGTKGYKGCQYVSDAFRQATERMVNRYSKKAYPCMYRILPFVAEKNGSTGLKFSTTGRHIGNYGPSRPVNRLISLLI